MAQQRTVLWRGLDGFSAEHCSFWHTANGGWRISGIVLLTFDTLPARVQYYVDCDAAWATRAVAIMLHVGKRQRALWLTVDNNWRWRADGQERRDLDGCYDIDLGVTPATNTLPIRRLRLAVGASAPVTAAWVRFPDLTVEPLVQRYTCLTERAYRYETDSGFRVDLDVDDFGLVTHYPDGWNRIAYTPDETHRAR